MQNGDFYHRRRKTVKKWAIVYRLSCLYQWSSLNKRLEVKGHTGDEIMGAIVGLKQDVITEVERRFDVLVFSKQRHVFRHKKPYAGQCVESRTGIRGDLGST